MPPLQLTVDTLDDVPEALRDQYTQVDGGKFRLQIDGYEDPTALKSALQKERDAARKAAQQAKAWAELGKSPEEIAELVAAAEKAAEDKAKQGGEWDKLRQQIIDKHTAELVKKDERISALTLSLERRLIEADATAAIAAAKGVPELLLPHVRSRVRVIEEDGEFKVQVVDASGTQRVDGKGQPLSIADLVGEMRSDPIFGRAFDSSVANGGGAGSAGGSGGAGATKGKWTGSESERIAAIRNKFPDLKSAG